MATLENRENQIRNMETDHDRKIMDTVGNSAQEDQELEDPGTDATSSTAAGEKSALEAQAVDEAISNNDNDEAVSVTNVSTYITSDSMDMMDEKAVEMESHAALPAPAEAVPQPSSGASALGGATDLPTRKRRIEILLSDSESDEDDTNDVEMKAPAFSPDPEALSIRTRTSEEPNGVPQSSFPTEIPSPPSSTGHEATNMAPNGKVMQSEVIDLLDSDDESVQSAAASQTHSDIVQNALENHVARAKNPIASTTSSGDAVRFAPLQQHPFLQRVASASGQRIIPGAALGRVDSVTMAAQIQQRYPNGKPLAPVTNPFAPVTNPFPPVTNPFPPPQAAPFQCDVPRYIDLPPGFQPTWKALMPPQPQASFPVAPARPQSKYYELSLLNVNEFTITGLPPKYDAPPTPVTGLRAAIRKISREHGKAVYERDKEGRGGKWRIPLGAHHALLAFLRSDPFCRVDGIPQEQLTIASLERARQEKGYPSVEKLVEQGVPPGLAAALAPFQRGGVDFVIEKNGRALIADDMGLGGVASMSVYENEWPLLVLCPSSARYHWESEFLQWLGKGSKVNSSAICNDKGAEADERLLSDWQVHVLSSSKADLMPYDDTKVVICSYGLAPILAENGKLFPSQFRCAIVDESHMLKNKSSKRTSSLVPILNATTRCVLLSGTPALARPAELWPQLDILRTEGSHDLWADEADYVKKYVKRVGQRARAELHTLLTGTVMIRRLKPDILKTLPSKSRAKALLHVLKPDQVDEFQSLLRQLRESKGTLGKIARSHHAATNGVDENRLGTESGSVQAVAHAKPMDGETTQSQEPAKTELLNALRATIQEQHSAGRLRYQGYLASHALQHRTDLVAQLEGELAADLERQYREGVAQIKAMFPSRVDSVASKPSGAPDEQNKRTTLLSRLYGLTGDAKVPLIADMVRRWLLDPTKGKLCIFAHHISVLNAIRDLAGLSNEDDVNKYIRIDGSTLPRQRQERIQAFQMDPSIRIALLGITAAGVAVTLTASSTVWFAELFWTPAIMIQAEDRCHRIGQSARVKCLYFVAQGTLDEILWKLIEEKFQDLGEFVEGKEKQKIVVEATYRTEKELLEQFESMDEDDVDDELELDADTGIEQLFGDLTDDIEHLGEEERKMLLILDGDDDDNEGQAATMDDRKMPAIDIRDTLGTTEDEAIALSDDEEPSSKFKSTQEGKSDASQPNNDVNEKAIVPAPNPLSSPISDCRLYRMTFFGFKLGISLVPVRGRVAVGSIMDERIARVGENSKPHAGDVLVAVNGQLIPYETKFDLLIGALRQSLKNPPLEITFAEAPSFVDEFLATKAVDATRTDGGNKAVNHEVIELIDDD